MSNTHIAVVIAAFVLLVTVLVLGFAPSLDDQPAPTQLGPFVTGDGDAVVVTP